ncbi:MAG: NAD(P)H-binding protein, partial [Acidimicrobiales bacterium]|nr:NAD(P)H-binding protein [Acidimicrobiales bacterium]
MKIAVAGGTGVVGRQVVELARARGHEPAVLSRGTGVDLRDEPAVAGALEGADAVVDTANSFTFSGKRATAFFTEVTDRLSRLGAQAGAARLVVLSIVGIDRGDAAYYRAKLVQEQTARAGPLALTIVRATQFHEFPGQILDRSSLGPLAAVPTMTIQPIAA